MRAGMARSIWNGTITFGMFNVPIKLYSATESQAVRFQEVHLADGAPIQHRRVCPKEDREVPQKEIVEGFEVAADEYVVLDKDRSRPPPATAGTSFTSEFVDAADIDPI